MVDYLNRISIIADCRICNNHQYNMSNFSFDYQILRPTHAPASPKFPMIAVICGVLAFLFLLWIVTLLAKKYRESRRRSPDMMPLLANEHKPGTFISEFKIRLLGN